MKLLALILILGLTGNALAFSAGGHRIIAEIAWQQLDEHRRAELVELIKHHPRLQQDFISKMPDSVGNGTREMKDHWLFLQASVWPDLARGFRNPDRQQYHRSTWHYVNFPTYIDVSHKSVIDLPGVNRNTEFNGAFRDDPDFNVVQATKANLAGLRDITRTKAQRPSRNFSRSLRSQASQVTLSGGSSDAPPSMHVVRSRQARSRLPCVFLQAASARSLQRIFFAAA